MHKGVRQAWRNGTAGWAGMGTGAESERFVAKGVRAAHREAEFMELAFEGYTRNRRCGHEGLMLKARW